MKKHLSLIFLLAMSTIGCNEENMSRNDSANGKIYTASFEQNESRTYIEEGNLLRWTEGDQISLFDGNTLNRQYKFDGKTGVNAGTFSIVNAPNGSSYDLTANYAVYPYASDITITEDGIITTTLPTEQNYAVNSFGLGANTMVAVTEDKEDTFLNFQNIGGYLKLQLYGDDVTVKSITLTGNDNEKLAGKATITPIYGQVPTISMTDNATNSITLDCGEGVEIGTTATTATAFWIVVPPTTFESGFTVTITDVNGYEVTKATSNKISIARNVIRPMTAYEIKVHIPYITFEAETDQTLTMSKAVATLEYSVNGGKWNTLGTTTVAFGGNRGNLRLRGKSSIGTATDESDYSKIIFGNSTNVTCSGDIQTIIDYENYANAETSNARFCSLFNGCTSLVQAPDLSIKELSYSCYYEMFKNCTRLVTAPELPSTNLANSCYAHMFKECTSLTKAPELPATTLKSLCYGSMFEGCTSLAIAPELPATNLANSCYKLMFKDCTNLTKVSELPATTLTTSCYRNMFEGCTNLIIAPKLLATTLSLRSCANMFQGCTSLVTAPELPVTTLATACYEKMFEGCTSLVTSPELPATNLANSCYALMFKNCTSLTKAPELPATTLKSDCYGAMFEGCTSLVTAPKLPATTLEYCCYASMFWGCTSLIQSPELPATTLVNKCYSYMFYNCIKLSKITMLATNNIDGEYVLADWVYNVSPTGTFIKASKTTTLPLGVNGIPQNWNVKNY